MKKTEGDLLRMVQDRLSKMDEIKHSVEISRVSSHDKHPECYGVPKGSTLGPLKLY